MDNINCIISGKRTVQVSEDGWERQSRMLKVNADTTIKQIIDWAKSMELDFGSGFRLTPFDISISTPQE